MAAAAVLAIPEILKFVLDECDTPRTLKRAACVNKLWSDVAIPILWHGHINHQSPWATPDLDILYRLKDQSMDRFHNYLRHVQILSVIKPARSMLTWSSSSQDISMWSSFRGKGLFWHWYEEHPFIETVEAHLRALLKPSLRVIYTEEFSFSSNIIQMIQQRCPDVRVLLPAGSYGTYQCETIESMINDGNVEYLGMYIEVVDCTKEISPNIVTDEPKIKTHADRSLTSLEISLENDLELLPRFLAHTPSLHHLSVDGYCEKPSGVRMLMRSISQLHTTLHHLDLTLCTWPDELIAFEQEMIAAIECCTQLRRLSMKTRFEESNTIVEPVKIARIQAMATKLRFLEELGIYSAVTCHKLPISSVLQLYRSFQNIHVLVLWNMDFEIDFSDHELPEVLSEIEVASLACLQFTVTLDVETLRYFNRLLNATNSQAQSIRRARWTGRDRHYEFIQLMKQHISMKIGIGPKQQNGYDGLYEIESGHPSAIYRAMSKNGKFDLSNNVLVRYSFDRHHCVSGRPLDSPGFPRHLRNKLIHNALSR